MSAAAVLRSLHAAGVEVLFEQPDQIRLRGPLTPEVVELARRAKADLLALVRPHTDPHPCACCGKFFFPEPATLCFWCRTPAGINKIRNNPARSAEPGISVDSVDACSAPRAKRACRSCGGGLGNDDPAGGPCWTCRQLRGVP